jgi:hypothetical protein
VNFKVWDEAIASRLAPIRTALGTIPVAALPKEAGKFGEIQFESIDWLFPSYQGSREENHRYRSQLITVTLVIRLYFQSRYPTGEERNTLEWCELQVLKLLTGYRLPDSNLPLALESGKLFAPTQGQWYKEIEFSFQSRLVGEDAIAPPPVQTIGIDDTIGQLIEVSS